MAVTSISFHITSAHSSSNSLDVGSYHFHYTSKSIPQPQTKSLPSSFTFLRRAADILACVRLKIGKIYYTTTLKMFENNFSRIQR